jgi:hypothetical protein
LLVILQMVNGQEPKSIFAFNRDSLPKETIYIHTNQKSYISGETIWFKAYLYSEFNSSTISSSFFVDLLNEKNSVLKSVKLPVFAGTASGQIDLPDTLTEGVYLIRAYTVWTLNLGEAYLFQKVIPVFNPSKKMQAKLPAPSKLNCLFYPESGRLINGLPNIVAFKAMNEYLQPVQVKVMITDLKGNEITDFISGINGTASFSITPQKGEKYFAKITRVINGVETTDLKEISLPDAKDEGVLLNVGENSKGKIYSVNTIFSPGHETTELLLLALMQNNIIAEQKVKLNNGEAQGIINIAGLPPGLMQLLIFDKYNRLLASRSCFIRNGLEEELVSLKADTLNFSKKGLNVLSLRFADSIKGSFSLSITDADLLQAKNLKANIIQSLLLQPGSENFISPTGKNDKQERDWLAQTNNWLIDSIKKEVKYRDEPYISITGTVQEETKKKRAEKNEINFIIETKDSARSYFTVPVLPGNNFRIENLVFEDTARFYYQSNAEKNTIKSISLKPENNNVDYSSYWNLVNTDFYFSYAKYVFADTLYQNRLPEIKKYIAESYPQDKQLEEVTVKAKRITPKEQVNKKYASGLFRNAPGSKTLDFINEPPQSGALNIFEYLKGKIPGLRIDFDNVRRRYYIESSRSISTRDALEGGNGVVDGKVFLNEMEVDAEILAQLSLNQIALVKFYPGGTAQFPGVGISCVLAVYTKQGEDLNQTITYLNSFRWPGYSVTRNFISPDYSKDDKIKPDYRTTLYWEPSLILDGTFKEVKVRFYNNDSAKKFKLILEGITDDGIPVHVEKIIE